MMLLPMKTGQKDNRGFSLVEMIVIIAILAVLSGAVVMSLGIVSNTRCRRCITSIEKAIGKTRITTMGRRETTLKIYKDGNSIYINEIVEGADNITEIGSATVGLTYMDDTGTTCTLDTAPMEVVFDRSSGVVKTSNFVNAKAGSYQVVLVKETGKCYIERV